LDDVLIERRTPFQILVPVKLCMCAPQGGNRRNWLISSMMAEISHSGFRNFFAPWGSNE